jgi:hypothetical protein
LSGWEPTAAPSRAAWKDGYRAQRYLDRERSIRERREQALREYLGADNCHHGRVRKVGMNDLKPWAGLECREGKCPIIYLSAAEIFTQWRDADSQPDSRPAGDGALGPA